MGIRILPDGQGPGRALRRGGAGDVVILPAFGVTVAEMEHLREKGCVLVDTTCGSVLNVWKNVHKYARDGLHRRHPRQALPRGDEGHRLPGAHPRGGPLPVRARQDEAELVCDFIRGRGRRPSAIRARFAHAASPGFDPERDLPRIGLANQTTMLMSESLEIQEMLRAAMRDRHGEAGRRALPRLRHHLLRHPGPPGRRAAHAGGAARST